MQSSFSLEDIPVWFADYFDITLATGQVILSIVIILAVLLPIFYLANGRNLVTIELIMLFLVMSLLVGIGWLPFWLLITAIAVMALAIASLGTKVVTGEGNG